MYTVFLSVQGLCENAKESHIKVIKTCVVSTISTFFVIRVTKKVQSFTVLPSFLNNLFEDLLCKAFGHELLQVKGDQANGADSFVNLVCHLESLQLTKIYKTYKAFLSRMFYQIDNLKNYKAEVFLSEEGLALDTSAF